MRSKINSFRKFFSLLFFVFSFTFLATAEPDHGAATDHEQKSEKLNVGGMILEHILDAHEWHLWGEGHDAVSVPLPVILYTDKGFDFFLSTAFHHGTATVPGKYNYRIAHQHIFAVNEAGEKLDSVSVTDFSITKNVAAMLISIIFLVLIFSSVAKAYTRSQGKAPRGLQSFVEPIILFIRDVAKTNIGEGKYEKYMPFLLTCFFFIWINNLLGLIPIFPGGANVTGNIAITLVLATITFLITVVKANKHYWQHIFAMPGVPVGVLVILTPIEILGMFIRPFVLMLRLFANITAGHIVILSFISLIFIFGEKSPVAGWGVSPLSVLFVVFMSVLELLVAILQAYVFTLLSSIYIGSAIAGDHHGDEDHH